jgi:NarL family two-component system response regulator LiaR
MTGGTVERLRLLLVDDHWVVRQGLRMYLERDAEFEIVGEAENGAEAIRMATRLRPNVVLMDLLMPVLDGVAATSAIREAAPDVEVLALTSVLEDDLVVAAIRAGAIGYALKDTRGEELKFAIRAAARGQVFLSPQAATRLLREVRAPETPEAPEALTGRESDILRLLAVGLANKEISRELGIGEGTVKTHVSNVLAKLGVQSRTQAALHSVRMGIVSPAELPAR